MSGKSAFPAFPASIPSSPWEEVLSVILWPRNPSFPFPTHRRFPPPQKKDRESIFMGHLNPGRNGKLSAAAVKKECPFPKRANEKTRLCRHSWIQDCRKNASHSNIQIVFYFSARLILDGGNSNQQSPPSLSCAVVIFVSWMWQKREKEGNWMLLASIVVINLSSPQQGFSGTVGVCYSRRIKPYRPLIPRLLFCIFAFPGM